MKTIKYFIVVIVFLSFSFESLSQSTIKGFDSLQYSINNYSVNFYSISKEEGNGLWFVTISNSASLNFDTIYMDRSYIPFSYFSEDGYKKYFGIEDYNLDGYNDIRIVAESHGSQVLFIYNTIRKEYQCKIGLGYNYLYKLDTDKKILFTVKGPWCGTGGAYRDTTYYNVENKKIKLDYYSNYHYSYSTSKNNKTYPKRYSVFTHHKWEKFRIIKDKKVFIEKKYWRTRKREKRSY